MPPDPWTTFTPSPEEQEALQEADTALYYYQAMRDIDAGPWEVSAWEARFLERRLRADYVLHAWELDTIETMAWKYLHEDIRKYRP